MTMPNEDGADVQYTHKTDLFTTDNGEPVRFYMRPCKERSRIKGLIVHGGGTISSKFFKDSIKLIPHNCTIFEGICYSTQYVWDCVDENQRLKIERYKRTEEVVEPSSDSDSTNIDVLKTRPRKIVRRTEYSNADDLEIIRYILETRQFGCVRGNVMWKTMEKAKLTSKNRSWQSMKERFNKKILPAISSYSLDKDEIRLFKKRENVNGGGDVTLNSVDDELVLPKRYTFKEDYDIVKYITDHRLIKDSKGNSVWKRMESSKVTSHSWQSMKERFRKHIVYSLNKYKISAVDRNWLQDYFGVDNTSAETSERISREVTPDSTISNSCRNKPVEHRSSKREKVRERNRRIDGKNKRRWSRSSSEEAVARCSKRQLVMVSAPSTSGVSKVRQRHALSKSGASHRTDKDPNSQTSSASRNIMRNSPNEAGVSNVSAPESSPEKKKKGKAGMRSLASTKIVPVLIEATPQSVRSNAPQNVNNVVAVSNNLPQSCECIASSPSTRLVLSISEESKCASDVETRDNLVPREEMTSKCSVHQLEADREMIISEDLLRVTSSPSIGPSAFGSRLLGITSQEVNLMLSPVGNDDMGSIPAAAACVHEGEEVIDNNKPTSAANVDSCETTTEAIAEPVPLTVHGEASERAMQSNHVAADIETNETSLESSQKKADQKENYTSVKQEVCFDGESATDGKEQEQADEQSAMQNICLFFDLTLEDLSESDEAADVVVSVNNMIDREGPMDLTVLRNEIDAEEQTRVTVPMRQSSPVFIRSNLEAEEQLIPYVKQELIAKEASQSSVRPVILDLGEHLEDDFNSWMASSDVSARGAQSEHQAVVEERVDENTDVGASLEAHVPEVTMQDDAGKPPLISVDDEKINSKVRKETLDKSSSDASCSEPCVADSDDEDTDEGIEPSGRPDALNKMLNGCPMLSTEDGFEILTWAGFRLNMNRDSLLKFFRGIVAHDLDTLLEKIRM